MSQEREIAPQKYEITNEMRRKAGIIALIMGGDYNMTVGVGPWGSGWSWDFVHNHVNMDARDLATEPEDVVKGVAAHEGSHRLVSRTENVMSMWQEPGFSYGFNAVEDPRANEGGMHFNPGTRDWIRSYIERDLESEDKLNYQKFEKAMDKSLGYIPDIGKWGAEMIRFWYEKEISGEMVTDEDKKKFLDQIPGKEVRDTVEKTIDFFEEYYKTIPDSKDEMDIQSKAKQAGINYMNNIWPIYKQLVEKSIKDQAMANMVKDMIGGQPMGGQGDQDQEGQQGQGGRQTGQTGGGVSSSQQEDNGLPEDVKKEIEEKIKQKADAKKDQPNKDLAGKGEGQNTGGQQDQQEGQGAGGGGEKIPWDQFSDKAKEAIKDIFDQLSKDKKDEYGKQAKKDIENAEDAANEQLRGKMNDPRFGKTHKEQREDADISDQKDKQAIASRQISDKMKNTIENAAQKIEENPYHTYLTIPEVNLINRQMERDFKKIFEPTEGADVRYSSQGLRPSMQKAMKMEADPRFTSIFESKGRPTERKYRFAFLIDLSGSMSGEKIEETFKSLIPIMENLNRFGIETAVIGFNSDLGPIEIFKPFEEKKLTKESRNKLGAILGMSSGSTPSVEATEETIRLLKKRMTQVSIDHNYFITLTDGAPDNGIPVLSKYLNNIKKDKSFVTAGFGIGPQSRYVEESYPKMPTEVKNAIARELKIGVDDVTNSFKNAVEFGKAFAIIVSYMVKRPDLFSR